MNRAQRRAASNGNGHEPVEKAMFAYIHPGEVSAAFMDSVLRMRDYELIRTQQLMGKFERRARAGAIAKARNTVTGKFFFASDAEWLLWLDADMGFPPHTFHQLRAVADPDERPIVGGLAFLIRTTGFDDETNAEEFDMMPTLQVLDVDDDGTINGWQTWTDYPRNALCRVHATGCACLLVHRSVFAKIHERDGINWFTPVKHPKVDEFFGEDTSFMIRCYELDIPVHIHTGVKTSHDKGGVFLTEQRFDEQEQLRALKNEVTPQHVPA